MKKLVLAVIFLAVASLSGIAVNYFFARHGFDRVAVKATFGDNKKPVKAKLIINIDNIVEKHNTDTHGEMICLRIPRNSTNAQFSVQFDGEVQTVTFTRQPKGWDWDLPTTKFGIHDYKLIQFHFPTGTTQAL